MCTVNTIFWIFELFLMILSDHWLIYFFEYFSNLFYESNLILTLLRNRVNHFRSCLPDCDEKPPGFCANSLKPRQNNAAIGDCKDSDRLDKRLDMAQGSAEG